MDLSRVLQQLHEELRNLNLAIASLERLQQAGKNRSTEPDWLKAIAPSSSKRNKSKLGKSGKTTSTKPEEPTEARE